MLDSRLTPLRRSSGRIDIVDARGCNSFPPKTTSAVALSTKHAFRIKAVTYLYAEYCAIFLKHEHQETTQN